MDKKFFKAQIAALAAAFRVQEDKVEPLIDVYWSRLYDIPTAKFAEGVRWCLDNCEYFPTIAELGYASLPPRRDYKAPLPPVDQPFATINWREQLDRGMWKDEQEQDKLEDKQNDQKRLK